MWNKIDMKFFFIGFEIQSTSNNAYNYSHYYFHSNWQIFPLEECYCWITIVIKEIKFAKWGFFYFE